MTSLTQRRKTALNLIDFIDASPSPWHAVAHAETYLQSHGFTRLAEQDRWCLANGDRRYVVRGESSLIAFVMGERPLPEAGLRLVGTHTDSPGLRLKPKPTLSGDGLTRLAVDVYGSPILATFADRDLSLAGRVVLRTATGPQTRLLRFERPLLRLPNLAIHLNRTVNEQGLTFNKQTDLPLLWGQFDLMDPASHSDQPLRRLLATAAQAEPVDLMSWDMVIHDTQKGCLWGAKDEFIASRQLDNLASTQAALAALASVGPTSATSMVACFDHEEVGSESMAGAAGSFMRDTLTRMAACFEMDEQDRLRTMACSLFISADMAHAWHPNFPSCYEPNHKILMNGGPAIKTHVNQRYATTAETAACFMDCCERAGVPFQHYAHRGDLGCGSTIGPLVAARLGIASVDIGSPLWAMHSTRESAGVDDQTYLIAALQAAFSS